MTCYETCEIWNYKIENILGDNDKRDIEYLNWFIYRGHISIRGYMQLDLNVKVCRRFLLGDIRQRPDLEVVSYLNPHPHKPFGLQDNEYDNEPAEDEFL